MGNSLISYMNKRLMKENVSDKGFYEPGPVITISREIGCNGLQLARKIAKRLNQKNPVVHWKVLSKEVFYESAKELDVDLDTVTKIFKQSDRYTFEEILKAFSNKQYKSEKRIVKTVVEVIRSFAEDGNCIIVGRAGHIIAKDIEKALHLRLVAPIDYRLKMVMGKNNLNKADALLFMQRIEEKRIAFRKAINENLFEDNFDLIINRASFDDDNIIDIIDNGIKAKKLLVNQKEKVEFF